VGFTIRELRIRSRTSIKMKAVVTGGAGFIGSHIAELLLDEGYHVIVIDDLSAGKLENVPDGARFVEANVCNNWHWIAQQFEGADVVFHNAASKKRVCLEDPQRDLRVNAGGTLNLLRIAVEHKVKKFVHASTGSVYGETTRRIDEWTCPDPVSYYGISKLAGENYVRLFSKKIDTTILRYFHVYGERQENHPDYGGVIAIFKKQIAEGKPIKIYGSGHQQRLFTHVEDIARANLLVSHCPETRGQIYNCVAQQPVTINKLTRMMKAEKIIHADPLEGDIFEFNVSNDKISKLGAKFRNFDAKWI